MNKNIIEKNKRIFDAKQDINDTLRDINDAKFIFSLQRLIKNFNEHKKRNV